ncbi:hypothetical protein [Streptomyces sp. NPDC001083]|uniref:hypothetical protein n=1 Tax=Streptomyces sp. NPDC001083 TaxID=3364545 RepID=UPI00367B0BC2
MPNVRNAVTYEFDGVHGAAAVYRYAPRLSPDAGAERSHEHAPQRAAKKGIAVRLNVMMIECPYCHVQLPARITTVADVDLARDDLPNAVPVTQTVDLRPAKTHAETCRSRAIR